MLFLFSSSFYLGVVGSLDQLSESRDGEVYGRAIPYLKRQQQLGFGLV